jgi:hypothetical protein
MPERRRMFLCVSIALVMMENQVMAMMQAEKM